MSRLRPGEMRGALEPMWTLRGDRAQVERMRRVLLGSPAESSIREDIIALLAGLPPIGLSGRAIARELHRDRDEVYAELRDTRCFVKHGRGRGTRYRLAPCISRPQRANSPAISGAPPPSTGLRDTSPSPASEDRAQRSSAPKIALLTESTR